MTKASKFAKELEKINPSAFPDVIEKRCKDAVYFMDIDDALLIMHEDGSVIIIEMKGGIIISKVISAENILKVIHHYRPFTELFPGITNN